jgi:DNA-directed RNA polymerase subunit RPC12/RpoP
MELKLVKTYVIKCAQCKRWLGRLPRWTNAELGKGHRCEYCGCTSIEITNGRPWGPRSRYWDDLVTEFNDLLSIWMDDKMESGWFLSTVVVV